MKVQLTKRRKGFGILAMTLVGTLVFAPSAQAIFGFGDIVFDPSTFGQALAIAGSNASILGQAIQTVQIGLQSYQQLQHDYALAQQMAARLENKNTWITAATGAANNFTQNQYGETVNWAAALNGNPLQAFSAYHNATTQLSANVNLSAEQLGSSFHLANLATVEGIDGTNAACLQAVAQYNQNQQTNQAGFSALNGTAMDGSDSTNSVVGQLNALVGGHAQLRAEQVSQGTLQACLVQEQILTNKIQRDNQVEAFNTYAQMQANIQANPMMPSVMSSSLNAEIQ